MAENSTTTTQSLSVFPELSQTAAKNSPVSLKMISLPNQNQLVQAAGKIFSIITQLRQRQDYHDPEQLHQFLKKELQKFQQQLEKLGYDLDSILIARYSLSACLDETINKTSWGIKANWKNKCLLKELQQETIADERFFIILDKICRAPTKYIDIIELMYICMNLGFEGKFQHQPFEKNRLRQVIDYTYRVIRSQRGEFDKQLSPSVRPIKSKTKRKYTAPLLSLLMAGFLLTLGLHWAVNYLLEVFSNEIALQLQNVTLTIPHDNETSTQG